MSYQLNFESDLNISSDLFIKNYENQSYVATEGIVDFFNKILDKIAYTLNNVLPSSKDIITIDVNKYRREAISRSKSLVMSEIADKKVIKPRNFKGYYIDYSTSLLSSSKLAVSATEDLIKMCNTHIVLLVNKSHIDNFIIPPINTAKLKDYTKSYTETKDHMVEYFPYDNNSTYTLFKEVFLSPRDLEGIYKNVDLIDKTLYSKLIEEKLLKETNDLSDSLKAFIDLQENKSLFNHPSYNKRLLLEALELCSNYIDFTGYLYVNINTFYKALQDGCKVIIESA